MNKLSITRQGRYQVAGGGQHDEYDKALEEAANLAISAQSTIAITPPSYVVSCSSASAPSTGGGTATPPLTTPPSGGDTQPPATTPGARDDTPATFTGNVNGVAVSASAKPGERVRAKTAAGSHSPLTLRHYADGCVCVENALADTPGDVALSGATLIKGASNNLGMQDGQIWAHTRTRPFWFKPPIVNPNWDTSKVPTYGPGSESASYASDYAEAGTGQMSTGLWDLHLGATGERLDLGLIDGYDAAYIVNPSAENAVVVQGMAEAAAPFPMHVLDPNTLKMLLVNDYPKATFLYAANSNANPIAHLGSGSPAVMDQAAAHGPSFGILASLVFGNEFFIDEMSHWANFIGCLWQNPNYRSNGGTGMTTYPGGQVRGIAWSLRQVAAAAAIDPRYKDYFGSWVVQLAREIKDYHQAAADRGDLIYITSGRYQNYTAMAPWQLDFLVQSLGYSAYRLGFTELEWALQQHGRMQVSRMLDGPWPLASTYEFKYKDADGKQFTAWPDMIQATFTGSKADLLTLDPSTKAFMDLLRPGNSSYRPGDFSGYPWSPTGYAAILQPALAATVEAKIPRADQAWALYKQWARADFSSDAKYNIVPV